LALVTHASGARLRGIPAAIRDGDWDPKGRLLNRTPRCVRYGGVRSTEKGTAFDELNDAEIYFHHYSAQRQ
jgi:hypothetical protein